jgi:type II secretory pathway pseudopilin PulG
MKALLRRLGRRADNASRSRGFTLVEIMVAMLILFFAMAGIVPFFLSGLGQASAVRYKSQATNVAREKMEQIRQLDYREIIDAGYLEERFGKTVTERGVTYDVAYAVDASAYDTGTLKKVTVTVTWTAPPTVSAASMTTMIHQQYLGPRISQLDLSKWKNDSLSPFPRLWDRVEGVENHVVTIHIAQADWGLVLDNLDQVGMAARDVYARLILVDANGQAIPLGDPDNDHKLTDIKYTTSGGKVDDVWFEYSFDSDDIPDGYWEMRAIVYNEYDEPGNVWRLRVRVENDPPAIPNPFYAEVQPDSQTVLLTWSGGAERDRDHYVLERRKWEETAWGDWVTLESELNPNATTYVDEGDISSALDPWGDSTTENVYQYRLYAVDIGGKGSSATSALALSTTASAEPYDQIYIPDTASTTTTTLTSTTTTEGTTTTTDTLSAGTIENTVNKEYDYTITKDDGTTRTGKVGKKETLTLDDLPPGEYLITLTCPGEPTIKPTFSMPDQDGQVIVTILK